MSKKESIADTSRVLSRIKDDGIKYRGFSRGHDRELGDYAEEPVLNSLANQSSIQMPARLLTFEEKGQIVLGT